MRATKSFEICSFFLTPFFLSFCLQDGEEKDCIPLQLQRLFGALQLSSRSAVETKHLTLSFGWEGSEVFQQNDVQVCVPFLLFFDEGRKDEKKNVPLYTLSLGCLVLTHLFHCRSYVGFFLMRLKMLGPDRNRLL